MREEEVGLSSRRDRSPLHPEDWLMRDHYENLHNNSMNITYMAPSYFLHIQRPLLRNDGNTVDSPHLRYLQKEKERNHVGFGHMKDTCEEASTTKT